MSDGKNKIAFVYYSYSTFVENDYEILSKHFVVNRVEYKKIWDAFKIAKVVLTHIPHFKTLRITFS